MDNLILWNFSSKPVPAEIVLEGLTKDTRYRHITLDAAAARNDENLRLVPEPFATLKPGPQRFRVQLEPYAIQYWSFE